MRPAGTGRRFLPATVAWLDRADPGERKSLGQYMTPRPVREALLDRVDIFEGIETLDPGCGTGEFLAGVRERQPDARLTGWDVDGEVLAAAALNVPDARLERRSAFDRPDGRRFDLVIGNPPYFQFRADPEQRQRFAAVISGRPNAFALFFQAAFEVVRRGGQVAFVVPPTMNSGAYFEALRRFIVTHGAIEHLELLAGSDLFEGANTAVQLIVIRVGGRGERFHLTRSSAGSRFRRTLFSPGPERLRAGFERGRTLWELGFEAVTGTVVWNQHRKRLARDPGPETLPLIWASNVGSGRLELDPDHRRPQYIRDVQPQTGPALVVNRVTGAVGAGTLRAAPVPEGMEFVAENHVNVIRPRADAWPRTGWDELLAALTADSTGEWVRLITGNTQLSAGELTHLVPFRLDRGGT